MARPVAVLRGIKSQPFNIPLATQLAMEVDRQRLEIAFVASDFANAGAATATEVAAAITARGGGIVAASVVDGAVSLSGGYQSISVADNDTSDALGLDGGAGTAAMVVVARASDLSVLVADWRTPVPRPDKIKGAVARNYGGKPSDYLVSFITDEALVAQMRADANAITFVDEDTAPTVSFEADTVKRRVHVSADKQGVNVGGTVANRTVQLTIQLRKADMSVDTNIGVTRLIPCLSPSGEFDLRVTFVAGVAVATIVLDQRGRWEFPSPSVADESIKLLQVAKVSAYVQG